MLALVETDTEQDTAPAASRPRFAWFVFFWMWLAFWVALFTLGLQEFRWAGGQGLWQVATQYGTAATISTVIGIDQLRRAGHFDALLNRPVFWFLQLWKRLPLETLCFVVLMHFVPRGLSWLSGMPYNDANWLETEAHDCAKFLLFYFLAGGIQFGIQTHGAWTNERLRAAEHARLAQQAQLAQLTQQLQPHFLFNGLNTISSLIHSDPGLADALLGRLATLLRAATGASRRSEQPLAEEIELVRAYVEIMTQRFADRVQVEWEIDEDAGPCLVPTFGLQPLLENCFRHVVEQRIATTHIVVRARRQHDLLCIEVQDDGEHRREAPVSGIGLGNLKGRLKSLHGERARLALVPRAGNGLIVQVEIPCVC